MKALICTKSSRTKEEWARGWERLITVNTERMEQRKNVALNTFRQGEVEQAKGDWQKDRWVHCQLLTSVNSNCFLTFLYCTACTRNKCYNGGQCSQAYYSPQLFICQCHQGFSGKQCEIGKYNLSVKGNNAAGFSYVVQKAETQKLLLYTGLSIKVSLFMVKLFYKEPLRRTPGLISVSLDKTLSFEAEDICISLQFAWKDIFTNLQYTTPGSQV